MSRLDPNAGKAEFVSNPCGRFYEMKNKYTVENVVTKAGKKKEVKVFDKVALEWTERVENEDGDVEYVRHERELPIEFAFIDPDWVHFKGWNKDTSTFYRSNEVNSPKLPITIRSKDGDVLTFKQEDSWQKVKGTKNLTDDAMEIKQEIKGLQVKQYSSIYIALKNADGSIELANLQLKGANLTGRRIIAKDFDSEADFKAAFKENKENPVGWWNYSKTIANSMYDYWFQINDWVTESGELGEYGILRMVKADKIGKEENEELTAMAKVLKEYHIWYLNKGKEVVVETDEITTHEVDTEVETDADY